MQPDHLHEFSGWGNMMSMKRMLSGWKYAVIVIGLAVMALLMIDFNERLTEWRDLTAERDKVRAEYNSLISTEANYKTQIAYATSEAAVMQWAYEDGHWVRSDEFLVVPMSPGDSTPQPTPTPLEAPAPPPNWQLWWSLFFDSPAP